MYSDHYVIESMSQEDGNRIVPSGKLVTRNGPLGLSLAPDGLVGRQDWKVNQVIGPAGRGMFVTLTLYSGGPDGWKRDKPGFNSLVILGEPGYFNLVPVPDAGPHVYWIRPVKTIDGFALGADYIGHDDESLLQFSNYPVAPPFGAGGTVWKFRAID
ncbi:hypothetical protein BD779DRAFT_1675130 [Infundibulicybe gibba]|nr:hypothetical protein BD779DRAFT_1675130 [Infundibulicybe gibba]